MKSILLLVFISTAFIASGQTVSVVKPKPLTQSLKMQKLFDDADPNAIQESTPYNELLTVLQPKKTGKMPVLKIDAKPVIVAELANGSYLYKLPIDNMPGITGDVRSVPVMPAAKK